MAACTATLLHSSSLLFRRNILLRCDFRQLRRFTSAFDSFIFPAKRFKLPGASVYAQAKRSLPTKDVEVASATDLYFESPLEIVEYPDPILRAKNKRIDTFDDNLKKLVDEMFDIMYKTDGISLSAPQVGLNVQLMVFNPVGERGEGEEIVLVNPRVTKYSKKMVLFDKGYLSFPGIYADVKRPEYVKIDARDVTGVRMTSEVLDRVRPHRKGMNIRKEVAKMNLDNKLPTN